MTTDSAVSSRTVRGNYLWLDVILPAEPRLAFIANSAVTDIPVVERVDVRVDAGPQGSSVSFGGRRAVRETDRGISEFVYGALHDRVIELAGAQGWTRLHMALVELGGRYIGIVGPSGVGKSTLAVAAARLGAKVHGDDVVFIRDGRVVALPRPLHIKEGTVGLYPFIASFATRLDYSPPVYVIDPAEMGWDPPRRSVTRLDFLVQLTGSSPTPVDGEPSLGDALTLLVREGAAFNSDHSRLVREVTTLLSSATILGLGRATPSEMAEHLVHLTSR
jgi:hypothetical protein